MTSTRKFRCQPEAVTAARMYVRDLLSGQPPEVVQAAELLTSDRLELTGQHRAELEAAVSAYVRSLRKRSGLEYRRDWDRAVLGGCQRTRHSAAVRSRFMV